MSSRPSAFARARRVVTLLACANVLGLATGAQAATLQVTHAGDAGSNATCTLRQAIVAMNTASVGGTACVQTGTFGNADRIEFAPGIDTITLADTATSTLQITALNLSIDGGNGVTVERAAGASHSFGILQLGTLSGGAAPTRSLHLTRLTIRGGHASGPVAGGISAYQGSRLTLTDCVVENNAGQYTAGGIFALGAQQVLLVRSTVRGNSSEASGGLQLANTAETIIRHSSIANNGCGGFICIAGGIAMPEDTGSLHVEHSTISGNVNADLGGGGIWSASGNLTIRNSTISGNVAGSDGGGILIGRNTSLSEISNSTIANNSAVGSGGGLAMMFFASSGPSLRLDSTLLSGNTAGTLAARADVALVPGDVSADWLVISGSHNLVRHPGGGASNMVIFTTPPLSADPLLHVLADNGGVTQTHALGAGSPAIDAGANPAALAFDQRGAGFPRIAGPATDIGAFETGPVASNGLCGAAHGIAVSAAPSLALCAQGAASAVSGDGPWTWTCAGDNGGTDAACAAPVLTGVQLLAGNSSGIPATGGVRGESVLLRMDIESSAATGTVVFCDGSGANAASLGCGSDAMLCAAVDVIDGQALCVLPNGLALGPHVLSAAYSGDGIHGAGTASTVFDVGPADTQVHVTLSAAGTVYAAGNLPDPVTVTVSVDVPAPGAGQPDGSVLIRDGASGPSCTVDLATQTSCDLVVTATAGAHEVIATYQPGASGEFLQASSSTPLQVRRRTYSSIIDPGPHGYGLNVNLAVRVLHGQAPPVAGTAMVCLDGAPTLSPPSCGAGGTVLCAAASVFSGSASCVATGLDVGTHPLVAIYLGNDTNAPSMSDVTSLQVIRAPSDLELTPDTNPSLSGDTVHYTARVPRKGPQLPTGTVDVLLDDVRLCDNVALLPDGNDAIATCDHPTPAAGVYTAHVTYAGDTRYAGSVAAHQQTVLGRSTLVLTSTPNPSVPGAQVVFSATATGSDGTPTGNVSFDDAGRALCTGVPLDNGVALCTVTTLAAGQHQITATYAGNASTVGAGDDLVHTVSPATVSLQPVQLDRPEGTGSNGLTLDFQLSTDANQDVIIDYFLAPAPGSSGDLLDDLDGPASGSVLFSAGSTQASLTLPFVGDDIVEPDEAFVLAFALSSDVAELSPELAAGLQIVLRNDDSARIEPGTAVAAENAPDGVIRFTWNLDSPVQGGVAIDYATQDGTAQGGSDYVAQAGTLQHDGDPASVFHLDVALVDDAVFEPEEVFAITVSPPRCAFAGCSVTAAPGFGTIVDDDAPASGLAIFVDNGTNASDPGDLPTYRITVVNASAAPALQVPVHDTRPAALLDALWQCSANIGGSCQPAAGSGNLATLVNLPPGAQASIELDARVDVFDPLLIYRVDLTVPGGYDDPDAADNVATDSDVVRTIFTDEFDQSPTS